MSYRCLECGLAANRNFFSWEHSPTCSHYRPQEEPTITTNSLGTKLDTNKPRMELLDAYAMVQLATVLTFGAAKYAPNNWRKGIQSSRLLAAALRHIFAYLGGQKLDEESGLSHLAHAMCCLMFAINLAETKPELSDHHQTTPSANQENLGG